MREAYDVLVYGASAQEWDGEGLVGPLKCTSCIYYGEAGGDMTLELVHPYDVAGKWQALETGNVLKVWIQMQTPPNITEDSMVQTSAEVWKVSATATASQRKLYKKSTGDGNYGKLSAGKKVVMVRNTASGRYKVKSGTKTGWMERDGLTYDRTYTDIGSETDNLEAILGGVQLKEQYFRIYSVERGETEITAQARHVSYDLMKNLIKYSSGASVTLPSALAQIRATCFDEPGDNWSLQTNLLDARTGIHWDYINPIKAIMDPEIGVMGLWDCEILRDNYDIYLLDRVGHDRGVRIEAGRNLGGITVTYDTEDIVTYIVPTGVDKDGRAFILPEKWIVAPNADSYPDRYIYTFEADGAKEDADVTKAVCYARMRDQAQALIDGGCSLPTVSMEVEVVQVDTPEGMAIVELIEPLALYDRVTLIDDRRGIETQQRVVKVEWDCIHARVKKVTLGAVGTTGISLPSWTISSVNGTKVIAGTLPSTAVPDNWISTRHVQAESINAEAIQAEAITTDKLAAGAVTAEKADIGSITAGVIASQEIHTEIVTAAQAAVGTANIDFAQIKYTQAGTTETEQLIARDAVTDKMYISKLQVDNAQLVNATVSNLVIKASDGNYYRLDVAADGSISPTAVTPTEEQVEEGQMGTGSIIETDLTVGDLSATSMKAINALIDKLTAARIEVGELTAREAFINALKTKDIYTDSVLRLSVRSDISSEVGTFVRLDDDGIEVGKSDSASTVHIDDDSVDINTGGVMKSSFTSQAICFGNYELRMSADGGLVFKKKEA